MKALSDSAAYLSECRRDIPLRSAFPLSCCDLFSASFSICHSDKRVDRLCFCVCSMGCRRKAVCWPRRPAETAKQEVKFAFRILTSYHLPRFLNVPNPTEFKSTFWLSAKIKWGPKRQAHTWIKGFCFSAKDAQRTACYRCVIAIVNMPLCMFRSQRQ